MGDLMEIEKPCPFCGEAEFLEVVANPTEVFVRCENCGADGPPIYEPAQDSENQAKSAWNERKE
jgi:Lar family restriction alleviation protein